ncbi:hypothetical protein ABW20_dc0107105 [Dactylellina cionopaga]|nr:hypothetical protein ABW20_dc0107105 [Dactylellina cionopaga]
MLSTGTTYINYQNDTSAANLFHLGQTQGFQPHLQLPLTNPLPLPFPDDLCSLDFSNPSVQEYLINNDVLDSLCNQDATFDNPPNLTGIIDATSSSASLPNTAGEQLLLNTPIAPQTSPRLQHAAGIINSVDVQIDRFSTLQEETTLSLGIMEYLENLERQIVEMRRFVSCGFARKDHMRSFEIERNFNFQHVTEVNEPFQLLLRSNGELPMNGPVNGVELKSLSHEEMDTLLDEYDLPFNPAMFLHEKQLLFLRFIGANRAIMHRVVD